MLKTRIIPTLLWKDIGLVKGLAFNSDRRVGSILPAVKVYSLREVDELILLDITATDNGRNIDFATVREISAECFVPLTVGGGIKDIETISTLLRSGADKVSINSAAYANPELIVEASRQFGSQCVVVSIDARKTERGYMCYSNCGKAETGKTVADWARTAEDLGAGEILITSIARDGTMEGYDLELTRAVTRSVSIPVIASGGAGNYMDFLKAIREGGASAVAAASMYHFTEQTPREAKAYLASENVAVRA